MNGKKKSRSWWSLKRSGNQPKSFQIMLDWISVGRGCGVNGVESEVLRVCHFRRKWLQNSPQWKQKPIEIMRMFENWLHELQVFCTVCLHDFRRWVQLRLICRLAEACKVAAILLWGLTVWKLCVCIIYAEFLLFENVISGNGWASGTQSHSLTLFLQSFYDWSTSLQGMQREISLIEV